MAALSEAAVLVTDSGLSAQASGALADHVGELVVVDPVDDDDRRPRGGGRLVSTAPVHLARGGVSLVLADDDHGIPRIVHWGAALGDLDDAALTGLAQPGDPAPRGRRTTAGARRASCPTARVATPAPLPWPASASAAPPGR